MLSKPPTLPFHEWVGVGGILGILFLFLTFSFLSRDHTLPPSRQAFVVIEGAVERPGYYAIEKSASFETLLQKAGPLSYAEKRKWNKKRLLRPGDHFFVPAKERITVHVEGAIEEPRRFRVYRGTRVHALLQGVVFLRDADSKTLQKRRYLRDGETLVVRPRKKRTKAPNSPL